MGSVYDEDEVKKRRLLVEDVRREIAENGKRTCMCVILSSILSTALTVCLLYMFLWYCLRGY
jgi:hypothetical protein